MKVELSRAQKLLDKQTPDPDKAIRLLHPLLKRQQKHWLVYYFLGIAQMQKAEYEKAIGYFEKSLGINSEHAQTYLLTAKCFYRLQDFEQAERFGKAAIQLDQELLDAWMFMGKIYREQAQLTKAIQSYTIANKLDPKNYNIAFNIAQIYADQGNHKKAIELFDIALQMKPGLIVAHLKKAQVLQAIKKYNAAIQILEYVLEVDSENLLAGTLITEIYRDMGRYDEALRLCEKFLKKHSENTGLRINYGLLLMEVGYHDKAEESNIKAINDMPEADGALSNYLMGIHYNPKRTKEEIFEAHALWDTYYAPKERPERPVPENISKDKKLRIGLISGGFKKHPVGWMITTALEHLPKDEIELFIYTTDSYHDVLTKRIRKTCVQWKSVVGYSDEVVADMIRDDEIDILMELSGHSADNRLKTVALEPAPISIKWVGGLFNTSGLKSMDYLLTDAKESPEGEEAFYTEKLVRMPDDYICFTPPDYDVFVDELPAKKNGFITFGCFNNPTKVNTELLSKWGELLQEVPNSRLYLKSKQYDTELVRKRVTDHLAELGIEEHRILFEGNSLHDALLETYNKVDIALDPWPYSGGLTTIEALWMGVPVVTKSGPTFAGRHSTTHLTNAGFPQWVTDNWEDYKNVAVQLSSDIDKLAEIRAGLRQKLLNSPVCDARRFANNLTQAFRQMWIQRVEGYENDLPEGEWQDHIWVDEGVNQKSDIMSFIKSGSEQKEIERIRIAQRLPSFKGAPSAVVEVELRFDYLRNGESVPVVIPQSEIFRLRNVFEAQEYALPQGYQLNRDSVIIDIGGNIGSFSLYARHWDKDCKIHVFEPNPQVFSMLEENTKDLGNITLNKIALSDRDGEIQLYQHPANTGCTSTTYQYENAKKVSVEVQKSGKALEALAVKKINVLKIDTEGAEVGILKGMQHLLTNTDIIMLEYHSEKDRREIDTVLKGFSLYASQVASPCKVGTVKYVNNKLIKQV